MGTKGENSLPRACPRVGHGRYVYGTGTRTENEEPFFRRAAFCGFSFGFPSPHQSVSLKVGDRPSIWRGQVSPQTEIKYPCPPTKGGGIAYAPTLV